VSKSIGKRDPGAEPALNLIQGPCWASSRDFVAADDPSTSHGPQARGQFHYCVLRTTNHVPIGQATTALPARLPDVICYCGPVWGFDVKYYEEEATNEAHLATQSSQTRQDPRVPRPYGHAGRPQGSGSSASQGPQTAHRLTSLKTDAAFRRLRRGRSGRARTLSVRWLPARHGEVRVGIVVSKKVGKAVTRNRVRRRLREILRRMHLPAADLMVIAKPEAATADFATLTRDLLRALDKSGMLTTTSRNGEPLRAKRQG